MSSAEAPAPDAGKKSKKGLFIIVGVVVILLGAGGGGYWMYAQKAAAAAEAGKKKAKADSDHAEGDEEAEGEHDEGEEPEEEEGEEHEPGLVQFEPFIVNLADAGGNRYLRINVGLLVKGDEELVKEIGESAVTKMKVRSAVLDLLAEQTAEQLATPEGKAELKKAIAQKAKSSMRKLKIVDVLFSEFIVQ